MYPLLYMMSVHPYDCFSVFSRETGVCQLLATVCGYLLYPLSYMMGVHPDDCFSVGALIGIKLFATPVTGFIELGNLIQNRKDFENYLTTNSTWHKVGTDILLEATNITLEKGVLQERSEVIATYAMCGFSAFSGLAIGLGGFLAVCPQRRRDIISVIPYAFFAGNMACFATGSVAGSVAREEHKEHGSALPWQDQWLVSDDKEHGFALLQDQWLVSDDKEHGLLWLTVGSVAGE
ncbi:hypothetical protein RRG08_067169 [Elysia crispata]|uniref:Concentrative nucleoside transporter C-terminal domain-containing protein n=1 Tax=Elysia crispata TaxID=231223 RepID=A0AAE1A0S3_9GAST|nr:hypothetical protein RRG08_067169 [Elysia crispata]